MSPSPRASHAPRSRVGLRAAGSSLLFFAAFLACTPSARAADEPSDLRLRIAWGGGAAVQWEGAIELSDGQITEVLQLGVDADETGSMHNDGRRLRIRQRSPRDYDGVDFLAKASPDATVTIRLSPVARREPGTDPPASGEAAAGVFVEEIPLAKLAAEVVDRPIGEGGHRVLLMRSPGDALRVEFGAQRDALVCSPGETLEFTVRPHRLPIAEGTKLRLVAQLNRARGGEEVWSQEVHRKVAAGGQAETWPLSMRLPDEEGVYDIHISAFPWGLRERLLDPTKRIGLASPLVTRTVQLVVLDGRPAEQGALGPAAAEAEPPMEAIVELDPANPSWWNRYIATPQLRKWSLLPKSSWDHGQVARWEHPELRAAMRIETNSWEALPLPVEALGMPHVVEVDYPSDVPQSLGISILDPNAAGELVPIGLDSGVYTEAPPTGEPARWLKHRIVFWPRSKTPLVLLVNRHDARPAVHGKIRVLAGPKHLPTSRRPGELRPERLWAGYLERPLLPENFSASETFDSFSRRSLDDWVTFYEAGTRLAEYLDFVGYGGVMAAVFSEGSTIYPSRVLAPTPRSDTGAFLSTGSDPYRKDALELLLRTFDRRALTLIPAVQFSTPLPTLEAMLDRDSQRAVGIVPIGPDGRPFPTTDANATGGGAYYNPLDERVQAAMLEVIAELVDRYGKHPSLGGVAVQLSTYGYGVLPGVEWSLDDATWAAYERDTGQSLDAAGPGRFAVRARAVTGPQRTAWLRWRAERIAAFQRQAAAIVARAGPDLRLYVSAVGLLDASEIREQLRPSLTRATRVDDVLLSVGLDVDAYRRPDMASIVFLRPNRFTPPGTLDQQAADLALNQSLEIDRAVSAAGPVASVFYHPPSRLRLPSFDEKSPVGRQKTYAWLAAEMSPSGAANRSRFVHALAIGDAPAMFDGGWMLPLGQEDSLRDLIDVYRRLPAGRFETVEGAPRPVTIRVRGEHRRTLAYAVNDSPWPVVLDVEVEASPRCRVYSLAPQRSLPELTSAGGKPHWRLTLEPYDVVAAVFTEPGVALTRPGVEVDPVVSEAIRRRVAQLGERAQRLAASPTYDKLINAGFETPSDAGRIPGWSASVQPGVAVAIGGAAAEGNQAATMTSAGRPAWLASDEIDVPASGRLAVLVRLRTADATRQPPLRVSLELTAGRSRYRTIAVGAAPANVPLTDEWAEYLFPFDHLPTTPGTRVRVRFDLVGAGEARIDDVRLLHLSLNREEHAGLGKIVSLANLYVREGQWADCADVLDGYWPRFLERNVPLDDHLQARREENVAPATDAPSTEGGSPRILDRLKKLKSF